MKKTGDGDKGSTGNKKFALSPMLIGPNMAKSQSLIPKVRAPMGA